MTVKELIEKLQKLNPDLPIHIEDISSGIEYKISDIFSNPSSARIEFDGEEGEI